MVKFIKLPIKGNKVKVYLNDDIHVLYGVVKRVEKYINREVVILEKSKNEFTLSECDFCLPENSVFFEN